MVLNKLQPKPLFKTHKFNKIHPLKDFKLAQIGTTAKNFEIGLKNKK